MKKVLVIIDKDNQSEKEKIDRLGEFFQIKVTSSLTLAKRLAKSGFEACVINADTLSVSAEVSAVWLRFYERVFKPFGLILIFWSWSDEFRENMEKISNKVFFVKKDCDEDNLLSAVSELLGE